MQLLFELNRHDYQHVAPAVINNDVIIKDKIEVKEIPRTIEILYEASKIPSADFYPVLEDSSDEPSVQGVRRRNSSAIDWSDSYGSSLEPY